MAEQDVTPAEYVPPKPIAPRSAVKNVAVAPQPVNQDMLQLLSVVKDLAVAVATNTQQINGVVNELKKQNEPAEVLALPNQSQSAMLQTVLNSSKTSRQQFYLIVLGEDGMPERHAYDTIEDMLEKLSSLVKTRSFAFPFLGEAFGIKLVNGVYILTTSYGDFPIPNPQNDVAADTNGWLGDPQTLPLSDADLEDHA